jgi:hypothetical protein
MVEMTKTRSHHVNVMIVKCCRGRGVGDSLLYLSACLRDFDLFTALRFDELDGDGAAGRLSKVNLFFNYHVQPYATVCTDVLYNGVQQCTTMFNGAQLRTRTVYRDASSSV